MDVREFFALRYEPMHAQVKADLLDELSDEQLRCRPIEGVNTIAWLVWHIARGEDIALSRFVARRPQLFFEERWAERLRVPETDLGVGMTPEEVTDLSARINFAALRDYWDALGRRTRSIVAGLDPEALDEDNDPAYIERVVDADRIFREAGRWGEGYWVGLPNRSKGYFLGYLCLTHAWVHLSEAKVTRSLLGRPGR